MKRKTNTLFSPIDRRAAPTIVAPFNMVAIRILWPGQSTKETR